MIIFENVEKKYLIQNARGNSLRHVFSFSCNRNESDVFVALSGVNFSIRKGESVGIIGRNGAGKSTLLKLLTRVTRPSSGRISVGGRMSSLLEVGAGFHHDLSGRENIFLAGAIAGVSRRQMHKKLEEVIYFSGVGAFIEQPVRTYSSGMYLRLAFSIGIHLDSDILVIDEALAVGDVNFQQHCLTKIINFQKQGGTLLLVSHDPSQLSKVCQRGIVLSNGRVCFDGKISEALSFNVTL